MIKYFYEDEEITLWADGAISVYDLSDSKFAQLTEDVTDWESRNGGQYWTATNPAELLEWINNNKDLVKGKENEITH